MNDYRKFYINGAWVEPANGAEFDVINPTTEEPVAKISLGNAQDVTAAVTAAQRAFISYSESSREQRLELLRRILAVYKARNEEMAQAITNEMGAPISLSRKAQVPAGLAHLFEAARVLETFNFEERRGSTLMRKEPVGVCGLITPWNWPMNQVVCKVAPALAAGCTMVLKPSELAPLSAHLFAEILHEAGVPAGVFNLVNGDGVGVGSAIASHPDVAMVSFTGSTHAGVSVATAAAQSVKRVTQELGGKSANIILDDADLVKTVREGVQACFRNSGQSCNAPTRMLVPEAKMEDAAVAAQQEADAMVVGDPRRDDTALGPLVSRKQFERVQEYIAKGIDEGAKLVTGGKGRPEGISKGYFVRPTVFSGVNNRMAIAREEIFGPVLSIIPYKKEEDAVAIANDSPYGLAAFVNSGDIDRARRVANRLRAGNVHINGARVDFGACFGGYKQSGNGREWGDAGLAEFLELKAVLGYAESPPK